MKPTDSPEQFIHSLNHAPSEDFLGLSPAEMHQLLYEPFGENSPLRLRDDIDGHTLDSIPLFRTVEAYLKILQREKQVKLTPLGALPRKVVAEVYGMGFLPDEHIESGISKLWREEDCIAIMSARISAEQAGLVRKANGKVALTRSAEKLLGTENRALLFKKFFQAYAVKFAWSFNDDFPEQPTGQLGWAFSVLMLRNFGDRPRTAEFYSAGYLRAFPKVLKVFRNGFPTPEREFARCYAVRTFERFFLWFGLATVDKHGEFHDSDHDLYVRTGMLDGIFQIKGH